jgi:hypothetical protein
MEKKEKTLPQLRITSKTFENMKAALSRVNKTQLVQMSMQEFRRLSYTIISNLVNSGGDLTEFLKMESSDDGLV